MSIPKDQAGLLGALIPNVFIDTITLESGGMPPEESNPHIDHQREKSQSGLYDPGVLRITIDSSIKEIISGDSISSWFGNKFAKYVRLKIVVSTSSAITAAFSSSNDGINILNGAYNLDPNTDSAKILNSTFPNQNVATAVKAHTQFSEFNIYTDVIADELGSTQHSASVGSDGDIVHDINFRATFNVLGAEPKHLSIFALAYLDMNMLVSDYGLSVDENTLKGQNGKIASEIVISSGKIVGESYIFTKGDGQSWAGAVHSSDDGLWKTGDAPSPESVPLKLNRVLNDKIQDFRDIDTIQRLPVDLSVAENSISSEVSKKFKYLKRDTSRVTPRNVYFSDLYMARDRSGNARMSFGLDYVRLLRENSAYEKLFSMVSPTQQAALAASCKIISMRLQRRRVTAVDTMSKLGNPVTGEVLFDKNQAPFTIAISRETSFGVFEQASNSIGSIRESFYTTSPESKPIRFFTATDLDVSLETDGLYQYGIEVSVEDASQKYVFSLIRQMRAERDKLYNYYLKATKLGMSKYIVELQDPHTDSLWERAALRKGTSGNFSPASGRFTRKFVEEQESKYTSQPDAAPWVQPIVKYFEMLNLFTGFNVGNASATELIKSIQKYAAPRSGSPKGVMALLKMMDNLITRVSLVSGEEAPKNSGESALYMSAGHTVSGNMPPRTATITHWFSESEFDCNVLKNVGWDYLSSSGSGLYNGLRLVTGEQYKERVRLESLRYFTADSADLSIGGVTSGDNLLNSGYGYLSPSEVSLGTSTTPFIEASNVQSSDIISEDQYSSVEAYASTSTSHTPPQSPVPDPTSPLSTEAQMYQSSMLEQFSRMNMTIIPPLTEIPKALSESASFGNRTIATRFCSELDAIPNDSRIDPVVSRVDQGGYNEAGMRNINANSLLLGMQSDIRQANRFHEHSNVSPFGTGGTGSVSSSPSDDLNSTNMAVGTISSFDIKEQANVVNWMVKTPEYLNDVAIKHGTQPTAVGSVVKSLPNQVKSLLLSSVSPASTVNNWHSYESDPISNPQTSSKFAILHHLINRVEFLVGYGTDIKDDLWKVLTYDAWYNSSGPEMICRMKPYECKLFGIYRPKTLEMPIYDEYFILTPRTNSSSSGASGGGMNISDNFQGVKDALTDGGYSSGIEGESTTNVVGISGATPLSHPCDDLGDTGYGD